MVRPLITEELPLQPPPSTLNVKAREVGNDGADKCLKLHNSGITEATDVLENSGLLSTGLSVSDEAALLPGSRAVWTNATTLQSEIVTIIRYIHDREMYAVRPVGRQARTAATATATTKNKNKNGELFVDVKHIKPAPATAFWLHKKVHGTPMQIPVRCETRRDAQGQITMNVLMDTFAGFDTVVSIAKAVLQEDESGDDLLDWTNKEQLQAALQKATLLTATYSTSDAAVLSSLEPNEMLLIKKLPNAFFDALMDFELVRPTDKMVDIENVGYFQVYQLQVALVPGEAKHTSPVHQRQPSAAARSFLRKSDSCQVDEPPRVRAPRQDSTGALPMPVGPITLSEGTRRRVVATRQAPSSTTETPRPGPRSTARRAKSDEPLDELGSSLHSAGADHAVSKTPKGLSNGTRRGVRRCSSDDTLGVSSIDELANSLHSVVTPEREVPRKTLRGSSGGGKPRVFNTVAVKNKKGGHQEEPATS